ncbi:hypothetical protein LA080_008868 [Diaporthe eres]|nr:hypothetical protein LA080_008868 [Diaporthe eres]
MNDSLSTIPPLYQNPNGDPLNYTNPPALTTAILGSGIALISMSSSFVVLRFATNLRISRKLHLDDMALDGVARHSWDVPITAMQPTLLYTSILVLYIRVFGVNRWTRIACYGACAFAVPVYWSNVIVGVVSCPPCADRPWEEAWVSCSGPGPQTSNLIIGVFSVIFDLFYFAIPFTIIAKLNLKRSTKQGLAIVFMFGFL